MDGNTETDCTADETPMISYANVHAVLKGRRNRAKASPSDSDSSQGPGVIVVGPTDSGKSTLSRMLLSWAAKQDLYKVLMKELAQILERQFAGNTESRAAGMVINTMGWIDGVGYEEKLCSMLKDVLKNKPNVDVVKLQKSVGVVSRNSKARQRSRSSRIRENNYISRTISRSPGKFLIVEV